MPIYLYTCPKCQKSFDIVKSMSDYDQQETCDCGAIAERKINFRGELLGTAVEDPEYNVGLGCWTKSKKHRQEIAKRRGLVEIGNDETPNQSYKRFEKERNDKWRENWIQVEKEITHGL